MCMSRHQAFALSHVKLGQLQLPPTGLTSIRKVDACKPLGGGDVAFLSLAADGAEDPAALLAAAHELFADAAGSAAAPRVLNVGVEINPRRDQAPYGGSTVGEGADIDGGDAEGVQVPQHRRRRVCSSDTVAAVWLSVTRYGRAFHLQRC